MLLQILKGDLKLGRKENRKRDRKVRKILNKDQYERLQNDINLEFIENEVEARCDNFRQLFIDCFTEAIEKNNMSKTKAIAILDDVAIIMKRNVAEKREKKNGES